MPLTRRSLTARTVLERSRRLLGGQHCAPVDCSNLACIQVLLFECPRAHRVTIFRTAARPQSLTNTPQPDADCVAAIGECWLDPVRRLRATARVSPTNEPCPPTLCAGVCAGRAIPAA